MNKKEKDYKNLLKKLQAVRNKFEKINKDNMHIDICSAYDTIQESLQDLYERMIEEKEYFLR